MGPGANTVEYSSDGKKILISSEWSIYYDLEKDTVLKIFNGRYPKFCPDNIHFVNNWADDLGNQRVYIYDLSNTTPEFSFSLYNADYCFSPDGKYLFVEGDPDRTVLVWDMITKQKIYTYPRMKYGYRCITASKDGNYIATSNAQIVYLFALRTTSVLDDYQTITLLSPNPTNNMVRIDFILQNSEIVNLRILNNSGQTLNTISLGFRESGNNSYSYDVSGLPSGIYFITLQTASISQTYKLVKE
jgi:WD40 repeat protein